MKKTFFTFISLMLVLLTALSASVVFPATAHSGEEYVWSEETPFIRYEDSEGIRYIGPVGNETAPLQNTAVNESDFKDADAEEGQSPSRDKAPLVSVGRNTILPDSVDLSESKYFPPIGNQGGLGSCATFSTAYYQLSYEMNKQRDVSATAENTLSPQLLFNLMSSDADTGTVADFNYDFLKLHGAPTMGYLPYSDQDRLSWHGSADIWRDALNSRVAEYYKIDDVGREDTQITSPDDEDLYKIKKVLSQGNVIVYATCIYSWVADKIVAHNDAPENAKFIGQEIVKYQDGFNGGHSMTLVGYNDNIWVDQNGNGKVETPEMGAFKIANSWGDDYSNGGFCWVAYDALNKVSAVEGGFAGNRGSALESFRYITVKPYGKGSEIYVRFTINTTDRVQMNVDFTAEHNGVEESNKFLAGSSYRNEGNRLGFDGTEDAVDATFCYALDNVSPELCGDNFNDYVFYATFQDTDADGKALMVKNVEIVNELTGKVYPMATAPFSLDGEKKTITIKDAETTDKTIYYIGYDEPVLHYDRGDGEFTSAKMEYSESRLGHNYRYVIEDAPEDITLYFTDDKGNRDDNGGSFFEAEDRLNFYRTENVREPLSIHGFGYENGLPDVNKRSYFVPDVTGGYEPYNFSYTIEQLETGKVNEYPYDYRFDKSHAFYTAGKYRISIEVRDQSGDTDLYEEVLDIINRPFVFEELTPSSHHGSSLFVGENISIYARTEYERIISRGNQHSMYEYVIKDSDGNVCFADSIRSTKCHLGDCVSHVYLNWITPKKGTYTVTVSSTDGTKDYAERTTQFTVFDKIYGDANCDGEVNVKDATAIQKSLSGIEFEGVFRRDLADCDTNEVLSIKDATCIRKYLAQLSGSAQAGKVIEYIPPVTEPETTSPTEVTTEPPVPETRKVTFTNSFNWSGTVSCYYWSDSNKTMTTWPGKAMTNAGTNTFGETLYTFEVPQGATYIIFTNGSSQTVDISYSGGEAKFYPLSETDSSGHYKVANW